MRKITFLISAAMLSSAGFAHATPLVEDSGWQYDQADSVGTPSVNSAITFNVSVDDAPGIFSLSDGFIAGDVYSVSVNGGTPVFSTFTTPLYTVFDQVPNNFGPYASNFAADFLNPAFSHLQLILAPGAYSLVITDITDVAFPAGFGVRLDSPIPSPATWAMLLIGVGGIGAALRSRRKAVPILAG